MISESWPIAECSEEHAAVANSSIDGSGKALRAFALAAYASNAYSFISSLYSNPLNWYRNRFISDLVTKPFSF